MAIMPVLAMRVTTVNCEAGKFQNSSPSGLTRVRKLLSKTSPGETRRKWQILLKFVLTASQTIVIARQKAP